MSDSNNVRAVVTYQGDVQRVGFRVTTVGLVQNAALVGWVMNEADGGVRLEVEGRQHDVDAFLKRISRELLHRIKHQYVKYREPLNNEQTFSIRY